MGSIHSADQRKPPRRPSLTNTERQHPDHQGTKRASLPSWGASSVGCSFGDGRGNHGALTEANRAAKEAARKGSSGQGILGKVSTECWVVNCDLTVTRQYFTFASDNYSTKQMTP